LRYPGSNWEDTPFQLKLPEAHAEGGVKKGRIRRGAPREKRTKSRGQRFKRTRGNSNGIV